jgi:hypothetical protein
MPGKVSGMLLKKFLGKRELCREMFLDYVPRSDLNVSIVSVINGGTCAYFVGSEL